MSPFLPTVQCPIPQTAKDTLAPSQPLSTLTSLFCDRRHDDIDMDVDFKDLDAGISGIHKCVRGQDPEEMILLEELDEKGGLLMEGMICYVFHPPPCMLTFALPQCSRCHRLIFILPPSYLLIYACSSAPLAAQGKSTKRMVFLRKAKGDHSLAVELSCPHLLFSF